jgi:hypothetical protein
VYRDPESELGVVSYQSPEPLVEQCRLRVERTTRARAQALVRAYHRHLPRPPAGEKAAFVVLDPDGVARGAATIGRPSSRALDGSGEVLEITRTATDGTPNACSALVAACVRYARTEGFSRVVTYTLRGESGSSLRAAGFRLDGETSGGSWDRASRERDERSELLEAPKLRWVRDVSTRSSSSRSRPSRAPRSTKTDLDDFEELWNRARPVDPYQIGRDLSARAATTSSSTRSGEPVRLVVPDVPLPVPVVLQEEEKENQESDSSNEFGREVHTRRRAGIVPRRSGLPSSILLVSAKRCAQRVATAQSVAT